MNKIRKRLFLLEEGLHSWDKYMLHASIKNHLNFWLLLLNFKICYFVTKKIFLKKIRSIFNENTDKFYVLKKKIRYVFNENTDQFYVLKKIRPVFNENTDHFCGLKKSVLKNLDQFLI